MEEQNIPKTEELENEPLGEELVIEKDDGEIPLEQLNWYGKLKRKMAAKSKKDDGGERKRNRLVSYSKYGYIFIIPFFLIFLIFQLIPLFQTVFYSFFEYYFAVGGLRQVGPNFVGFANYATLFQSPEIWQYVGNTMIIFVGNFIPQLGVSLLLAIWFTDARLKLKMAGFFKAVMYMPNLVMASAFGMLFLMLFGNTGPVNQILNSMGIETIYFRESTAWSRTIICLINWLMWFGNTTILLMSGIMGIDESIFESARLDGSGSFKTFRSITLPLLMPILVYVLITSLIGGIQLFDSVQIFTETSGGPNNTTKTIMMYLYQQINSSRNYGMAGAVSVILFIITGILSIFVFKTMVPNYNAIKAEKKAYKKRMRWLGESRTAEEGGENNG